MYEVGTPPLPQFGIINKMFPVKDFWNHGLSQSLRCENVGHGQPSCHYCRHGKHQYRFNLKTQNKQCVPGHRIGFLRKITGTNSHVYNLNAVNHKFRLCTIVHTSIFLWFTTFFKHLKILWLLLFAVPQMDIERIFRLKLHGTMQTFKIPSWSLFAVLHMCLRSCVIFRQFYQWQWRIAISRKLYR